MEVMQEIRVFNQAWEHVKKWEGGFVNDQYDRGGETKFGISQRQYPDISIRDLTEDQAKQIAKKDYWSVLRLGYFKSEQIAIEMFDFAFNAGVHRAALALQRALVLINFPVEIDGNIGPKTVEAVNFASTEYELALLHGFQGYEFLHYKNIVLKNPSQARFIRGWLARI
jgi:lysozyme family protein